MSEQTQFPNINNKNYKLIEVIGEGAMGTIYKAQHTIIGKNVALKLLRAEFAKNPTTVERFLAEAKAANKIKHQHIIDISDYGTSESGQPYFIMELLEGKELSHDLADKKAFPLARAIHIAAQIARALEASHQAGIVHRDLKPENVFLISQGADDNFVKVLDFGIAKVLETTQQSKPADQKEPMLIGTPAYMAPEQITKGDDIDHRADLYALGTIFYELLTGKHPIDATNVNDLLVKVIIDVPRPPHQANTAIPQGLSELVLKLLQKEPSARYQSATELLQALNDLVASMLARGVLSLSGAPLASWLAFPAVAKNISMSSIPIASLPLQDDGTTLSGSSAELAKALSPKPAVSVWVWAGAGVIALVLGVHALTPSPKPAPQVVVEKPATLTKVLIEFTSTPPGATVMDNGVAIGVTPYTLTAEVSEAQHDFSFLLDGHARAEKRVALNNNRSIEVTLQPLPQEPTSQPKTTKPPKIKPIDPNKTTKTTPKGSIDAKTIKIKL